MPDDLAQTPLQNDGSYEDAVASMPDLLADDPKDFDLATGRPIVARDEVGKFKNKEQPAEPDKAEVKEAEDKEKPEAKAEENPEGAEDDGDYVELPPEKEGDEPVRHKLDEIVEGWQKAKTLETELAEAKKAQTQQPLPQEIETHVVELQKERAATVKAMKEWQALNQPRQPNINLTNPQHPDYNPELFHSQVQVYQRQLAWQKDVAARIEEAETQTKSEQEALRASRIARESAELRKFWPEVLDDPNARTATKKALFDHYKIDDAMLDSDLTLDHRIYALAKDALAFRALQGKQAEAVKSVKAKPKLIQGHARATPSNPKVQKQSQAFTRLAQSGSVEDAADALEGFL
jgi:hypothetical protein